MTYARKPFRPVVQPGEMRGRDSEIVKYLRRFEAENGRMPTFKEAERDLNTKRGALWRNIIRLEMAGILRIDPCGTIRAHIVEGV